MSNQLDGEIVSVDVIDLNDKRIQQKFDQWIADSKQLQIRLVCLLTGVLYIVSSQLDRVFVSGELLSLMLTIHLYLLPFFLFFISLLTFSKKFLNLTLLLLIIAPIGAAIGNLIITVGLEQPSMRLTEIYLILFWIFTISGLGFHHAIISAFTTATVVFVVTYFFFSMSTENFVMHCFWMSASLSFGVLTAYLLETSNKALFIKQLQLQKSSQTDRLTGMYNRVKLDEVLNDELQRSQRYGDTFGLVIMDFDHFKEINDTYGHQVGDEALKEIAKLITENLRSSDKAVRWGGEEFIVIYLDTSREEVLQLAEKLRVKIENYPFKTVGTRTASFGVTLYHVNDTIDSIIQRADKALFRAKNGGRNRIVFL